MQSNNLEDKAAGRDRKEIRHLLQTFLKFGSIVPDFYTLVLNSSSGKLLRNVMEIKLEKRFDHWVETAAGRY